MPHLRLTHSQAKTLAEYALAQKPQEICGFLAGSGDQVHKIIPIANIAERPETHFQMDPIAQLKALKSIQAAGIELLAIYHSHPKTDPIPSQADIKQNHYPNVHHVIISLKQREPRLKAWQIQVSSVQPVDVILGNQQRPIQKKLTPKQVTAIFLSAAIAVLLLLIISISLLPPAPPLPTPGS